LLDAIGSADLIKAMDPGPVVQPSRFLEVSNLDTIIGQHCVQPTRHGGDQCFQEAHGDRTIGLFL